MNSLFIATDAPTDIATAFVGIQRPLAMFIEVLRKLGQLGILLYVAPDMNCSPAAIVSVFVVLLHQGSGTRLKF